MQCKLTVNVSLLFWRTCTAVNEPSLFPSMCFQVLVCFDRCPKPWKKEVIHCPIKPRLCCVLIQENLDLQPYGEKWTVTSMWWKTTSRYVCVQCNELLEQLSALFSFILLCMQVNPGLRVLPVAVAACVIKSRYCIKMHSLTVCNDKVCISIHHAAHKQRTRALAGHLQMMTLG